MNSDGDEIRGSRRAGPRVTPHLQRLATLAVALLAIVQLVRLAAQAVAPALANDECFHAHVAERIAREGRLPDRLPELYGGLSCSYPPLLHLLGAGWLRWFAPPTLPLLNLGLFALLLLALAAPPAPGIAPAPRRWALWLMLSNATLAACAVSFYAETLISLLGLVAALLFVRAATTRRMRDGVLLGVAVGLAMLAKNTAVVLPVLLAAFAGVEALARRRAGVRTALAALAVALAIAAPMYVRNAVLFGSPVYPGGARDFDPWLDALNRARFGRGYRVFLHGSAAMFGPWLIAIVALALAVIAVRRRRDVHGVLVVAALVAIPVTPVLPVYGPRHVLPLAAVLALSASVVLHDALGRRRVLAAALECALAAVAIAGVARMGNRRATLDEPPELRAAYRAIAARVPPRATGLSLWTYDTFYYTRRPTTWPIPWDQGPGGPVTLFRTRDPGQFLTDLDRLRIRWVLMPTGAPPDSFDGTNYPGAFADCVARLTRRPHGLRITWTSETLQLVERSP